jgi:hypothetical protein
MKAKSAFVGEGTRFFSMKAGFVLRTSLVDPFHRTLPPEGTLGGAVGGRRVLLVGDRDVVGLNHYRRHLS